LISRGDVAGQSGVGNSNTFLYRNGALTRAGDLDGCRSANAEALNDADEVVGSAMIWNLATPNVVAFHAYLASSEHGLDTQPSCCNRRRGYDHRNRHVDG
jgi:hypothetical protein